MSWRRVAFVLMLSVLLTQSTDSLFAADSTVFDPTKVKVAAKGGSGGIPVGTVISWPVATNPADMQNSDGTYNWLECNGQSISQTAYPELFALTGGKVPDYRGLFLRGQGGASDALGVKQGYAVPSNYGKGWFVGGLFGSPASSADGKIFSADAGRYIDGSGGEGKILITTFRFNLAGDTPTANEVRPVNTAVRYFIRARP